MLLTDKGSPDSTARHVLQALAEHAHKDGTNAHPSLLRLQYRTGYNRRTVQRALRRLEEARLIEADGTVHACTRWRLAMDMRRPASDWEELKAEEEALREAAAERKRKSRARHVTHPDDVTVTDAECVTDRDVTHSASGRHALEQRDVTHSEYGRHALSAARTYKEPSVEPPENQPPDGRRPPTGSGGHRASGSAALQTEPAPDHHAAALGCVLALLPPRLRQQLPTPVPRVLTDTITAELRHGTTTEQLVERAQRRWLAHGYDLDDDTAGGGPGLLRPVGVAVALLRRGRCTHPRCDDGTDLDTGQPCRTCEREAEDRRAAQRRPVQGAFLAAVPTAATAPQLPRPGPMRTCHGCERPSRTLAADGWCRDCRAERSAPA